MNLPSGTIWSGLVLTRLRRETAALLLKMAKTTSDQRAAAAMVTKAADIKDRLDGEALPSSQTAPPNILQQQ